MRVTSNAKQGFTVVELIVVIVVIGILLTLAVVSFSNSQSRAKKEEAIAVADKVKLSLGAYFSEKDRYPKDQSTLVTFITSKGDSKTATAFNDTDKFVYQGTTAAGGECDETSAVKCEKYTITIKKSVWNGSESDADEVIKP